MRMRASMDTASLCDKYSECVISFAELFIQQYLCILTFCFGFHLVINS